MLSKLTRLPATEGVGHQQSALEVRHLPHDAVKQGWAQNEEVRVSEMEPSRKQKALRHSQCHIAQSIRIVALGQHSFQDVIIKCVKQIFFFCKPFLHKNIILKCFQRQRWHLELLWAGAGRLHFRKSL